MIKRITIKKLFGLYDYDVVLSNEMNTTIITGPNGYGKTTILNIINHLHKSDFWYFYFLPFELICLEYSSDDKITIKKRGENKSNDSDDNNLNLDVEFIINEDEKDCLLIDGEYIRVNADYLRSYITNNTLFKAFTDEELFAKLYDINQDIALRGMTNDIIMFVNELPKSLFLSDNRIIAVNELKLLKTPIFSDETLKITDPVINLISNELVACFSNANKIFAEESQLIDTSFLKNLDSEVKSYTKDEIVEIKKKAALYKEFGLFVGQDDFFEILEEKDILGEHKFLALYLNNIEKKLSIYDELYARLKLLNDSILAINLSDKTVHFNKDKGIVVKNKNGVVVSLDKLSSGEQNIIILYFKLIFNTTKGSILLIDEPETSLHMAWLSNLLDTYLKMAKTLEYQIVIATHSPAFISGEWDMTVDLYEITQNV